MDNRETKEDRFQEEDAAQEILAVYEQTIMEIERMDIRPMKETDLPDVMKIEVENFSVPWSEQSFQKMLADAQALFLIAERETKENAEWGRATEERAPKGRAKENATREGVAVREGTELKDTAEDIELAGYAGAIYAGTQADVTNIAVRTTCKQRGIGTRLLTELLQALQTRGVEEVFLEVRESNVPALALYRHLGFETVGRRKGYYTEPQEDAILMKCSIPVGA